ncbi:MAG: polyphosphate polymerase domain-containing protein [Actinomycetales bacterium]|nr:polyphosphate polymerase domain-containing protein [Actinomycetales bacterium]
MPGTFGDGNAGSALRAPTPLHAFNRYEIKYLVDVAELPALRAELERRLDPDVHAGAAPHPHPDLDSHAAGYGVWSVYYDTADLRFYWEKIEGLRFRRKLRIRRYGTDRLTDDEEPVHVEIKQRVNRVTQKRRLRLPYREALRLCDQRQPVDCPEPDRALAEEVLGLVCGLDLRPTTMTGYLRSPYVGRDAELGLRVTIDQRVRGRDRDLRFGSVGENRFLVPPTRAVVEIKADERVPYWLTDLTASLNLSVVRLSKYCQSVEVFGRAPRSRFHLPADACPDDQPTPHPVTEEELSCR